VLKLIASGQLVLTDLGGQNKSTLLHVQRLVLGIKKLLYVLSMQGQTALLDAFQKSLQSQLSNEQASALVSKLPAALIMKISASWMPALSQEMKIYQAGKAVRTKIISTKSLSSTELPAEDWVSHGGWYAQDFSLYYRPAGHQDVFLKTLLDLSAVTKNTSAIIKQKAFEYLSYAKRSGQCIKCHSIDELDGKLVVNWKAKQHAQMTHQFNRFNHSSHFSLLTEKGCLSCHKLNETADTMKSFKKQNPFVFESNWQPIEKSRCVQCHNEAAGLDNCTLCHNYHVGESETVLPETGLSDAGKSKPTEK